MAMFAIDRRRINKIANRAAAAAASFIASRKCAGGTVAAGDSLETIKCHIHNSRIYDLTSDGDVDRAEVCL